MPASKTILLVDGEGGLQRLRAMLLSGRGFDAELAKSLEDGFQKIRQRQYQLVVVDVKHYAQAALDFCEEVKRECPDLKVALMADHTIYFPANTCPDEIIRKQDGPEAFLNQVEGMLHAS